MADREKTEDSGARANSLENAVLAYKPIENEEYNRRTFVYSQDELNDLNKYNTGLGKDPTNPSLRRKLSKLLFKDKGIQDIFQNIADSEIRKFADAEYSKGRESMARYAEKNRREFFDEILDGEALKNLVVSVPLYETKNRENDDLADLIGTVTGMEKAAHENKINEMRQYIMRKIKSDNTCEESAKVLAYFANDDRFMERMFEISHGLEINKLEKAILKDGKFDKERLKKLAEDSLDVAYEQLDKENDEGKRKDIWEVLIRPYYEAMVQLAYNSEKEKQDEEDEKNFPELRELREREAERRELGMAA